MYKILISGYYGFNNIGDESILSAVVDNLKEKLDDIQITVLSQNPESTAEKYDVRSVNRKSVRSIFSAVRQCDLLISGGGSLLQDATSSRSIYYYLFIMWLANLLGKKFLIYSQGIGPIKSKFNRKMTARMLGKASGIVVRDETSAEFLQEIGIPGERIVVTADPVLRIKPAELETGRNILREEGFVHEEGKRVIGFAMKEKKISSQFVDET
ncbi:MAG: polysaccharide pyruvyl transferase family protein, partial [Clostridia bacterium]|nr:polysaccharide pyruvyl transferase family protein [Clostridia bacterium]